MYHIEVGLAPSALDGTCSYFGCILRHGVGDNTSLPHYTPSGGPLSSPNPQEGRPSGPLMVDITVQRITTTLTIGSKDTDSLVSTRSV